MLASYRKRHRSSHERSGYDYWPGFVDALSTLLIVILFLVLVFVLAQFFFAQALSGRDDALTKLREQLAQSSQERDSAHAHIAELNRDAQQLATQIEETQKQRDAVAAQRDSVIAERDALTASLGGVTQKLNDQTAQSDKLAQILQEANKTIDAGKAREGGLEAQIKQEQETLAAAQKDLAARDIRLAELMARNDAARGDLDRERQLSQAAQAQAVTLDQQTAALRDQLARLTAALGEAEQRNKDQALTIADLGARLNTALAAKVVELARYRSEFFGRLREVLGAQPNIRIAGDRFVFQSEVLFEQGSAVLGKPGREQLQQVARSLIELAPKIPQDINWILRVDGHTDRIPIHNAQFTSNWELSSARALAVVRFLSEQGVASERLAAAGYGEFQPLDPGGNAAAFQRNRRIELKLTDR